MKINLLALIFTVILLLQCTTANPSSSPVYQDVAASNGVVVDTGRGMATVMHSNGVSRHQKAQAQSQAFFGQ